LRKYGAKENIRLPLLSKLKNKIGFFLRVWAIARKGKQVFHITFSV